MSLTYIPAGLRQFVFQRAQGRCEYCLIPETATFAPHEIDHIVPEKHGGLTEEQNLAVACTLCNKLKGTDLTSIDPETNEIVLLFHPRRDLWSEHFKLSHGRIIPLTAIGRATERLLRFNVSTRIKERELLIRANQIIVPR